MKTKEIKNNIFSKKLLLFITAFVVIIAIAVSYYFFSQYQQAQKLLNNPTQAAQEEVKELIGKVGNLMVLPNENPTIATVSDPKKLVDQPFFAKAMLGDKVLIYSKAREAILYRPSINKIIQVAPVNLGLNKQSAFSSEPSPSTGAPLVSPILSSTPTPTPLPIKVAIYNGTKTSGFASTIEKELKAKMSNIEVVVKVNTKGDYTKTIIIDLSNNQSENASKIASILGGEIGLLPPAETKPANADILVILGK